MEIVTNVSGIDSFGQRQIMNNTDNSRTVSWTLAEIAEIHREKTFFDIFLIESSCVFLLSRIVWPTLLSQNVAVWAVLRLKSGAIWRSKFKQ